jgi:hypothetical protein
MDMRSSPRVEIETVHRPESGARTDDRERHQLQRQDTLIFGEASEPPFPFLNEQSERHGERVRSEFLHPRCTRELLGADRHLANSLILWCRRSGSN